MHRDARLTPTGRRIMIEPIAAGPPQAHVAQQTSVSRATVSKWRRRPLAEGDAGMRDRSSKPHRSPPRTSKRVEERVCRLRRSKRQGATDGRDAHRRARVDGAQDPGPPRPRPARPDRSPDRTRHPPLRTRPSGRADPSRRRQSRRDPARRRLAGPRPRPGRERPGRLHVPALRGRRPLAGCLCRSPRRRTSRNAGRAPVSNPGPVPGPRHDHRRRDVGQRIELPGPASSPPCRPDGQPGTAAPARTGPRSNGKVERFNGPSPTGSSRSRSDQRTNDDAALTAGSMTTTITATTPPSAAHPHHASTTSVAPTPRLRPWR